MILLWSLFLFYQTPAKPVATPPPPTATQSSAVSPAVKDALNKMREDLEKQIKEGDAEQENAITFWTTLFKTALALIGLNLLVLFGIWKKAKKKFTEIIEEKLQEQAQTLFKVLDNFDLDQKLKTGTRIHLLTATGNSQTRAFMMGWGFKKISMSSVENFLTKPDRDAFDILLFDRLTADQINRVLAEIPDQICVAYAPDGPLEGVNRARLNFANSRITLFTRILETARFNRDDKS